MEIGNSWQYLDTSDKEVEKHSHRFTTLGLTVSLAKKNRYYAVVSFDRHLKNAKLQKPVFSILYDTLGAKLLFKELWHLKKYISPSQ